MSYLVLMICYNEIQYIKLFESRLEAQTQAILLSNEWYNHDGLEEFAPQGIKSIEEMDRYYQSEAYINSGDFIHILIEELIETNLEAKLSTKGVLNVTKQ